MTLAHVLVEKFRSYIGLYLTISDRLLSEPDRALISLDRNLIVGDLTLISLDRILIVAVHCLRRPDRLDVDNAQLPLR